MMKNVSKSRLGLGSARVVFPLPSAAELQTPAKIDLVAWLDLPIERRAPPRSVAFVDVLGHRVYALIIDTLAGQPLWLVTATTHQLGLLHEGVLGERGQRRDTALLSVRLPDHLLDQGPAPRALFLDANADAEDCGPDGQEVRGDWPGGGSPGLVVVGSVVADVIGGLSGSSNLDLGSGSGVITDPVS